MNIVTDNSAVIATLNERIAELEKQLEPDIFWPDECEEGFSTEHDAIESILENSTSAKEGDVFTLQKAVFIKGQDYVITDYDEDSGSFSFKALKEQGK